MREIWIQSILISVVLFSVHAVVLYFAGNRRYVARALLLYAVFGAAFVLCESLRPFRDWPAAGIILFTVGLLWACQMVVVVNLLNSVSFRMVRTLLGAPGGRMERGRFLELFSERPLLEVRLKLLEDNGFIVDAEGERIVLTPRGRGMAGVFSVIQRAFRLTHIG